MIGTPKWIVDIERRTRTENGTKKTIVCFDPDSVIALCDLIRQMGEFLEDNVSHYRPGQVVILAYQRGPVISEGERL